MVSIARRPLLSRLSPALPLAAAIVVAGVLLALAGWSGRQAARWPAATLSRAVSAPPAAPPAGAAPSAWLRWKRAGVDTLLSSPDLPGVGGQVVETLNRVGREVAARAAAHAPSDIDVLRELQSERFAYRDAVRRAAARHAIDVRLILAIITSESGGDPAAVSQAGAIGLMQLMPATAQALGIDPRDPVQNIDGAVRYLASLMATFRSVELSLVAYNAGPTFALRYQAGAAPLDPETREFVTRVGALLHSP